jgi:hypothetical protein
MGRQPISQLPAYRLLLAIARVNWVSFPTLALYTADDRRQVAKNTPKRLGSLTIMHYISCESLLHRALPLMPEPKTNTRLVVTRTDQPCSYMLLS